MGFNLFRAADVAAELKRLNSRKSPGTDSIPDELLKQGIHQISQHLADNFNRSLSEEVFSACWKLATRSPILKCGKDASLPSLYRPIALLSGVSKVFEHLVDKQLVSCFKNGLLPNE